MSKADHQVRCWFYAGGLNVIIAYLSESDDPKIAAILDVLREVQKVLYDA